MRFHSVKAGDAGYAIYFPETSTIIKGSENEINVLNMIVAGKSCAELEKEGYVLGEETYLAYKKMLGDGIDNSLPERDRNHLPELVVHVSNDCNMRCLYCYGQGGCYNMKRELMTGETVIETLDKMYAIYPQIDFINFFGGEPTMNLDVVKVACQYVKENRKNTYVGIVSNGTYAGDELVELIKDYGLRVTFSVDMQPMQDMLRPLTGGAPSYDLVLKNFRYLRERTEEPFAVEITYTEEHRVKGYSPARLIKDIRRDFGDVYMVFNSVTSCNPRFQITDFSNFGESLDELKEDENLYNTSPFVTSIMERLSSGRPYYHFCGAGFGKTAVSATGDIYACQGNLGVEELKFGNVYEPVEVLKEKVISKSDELYNHNKAVDEGNCKDCYLNTYCHRCINNNKMETGDYYESPEKMCDMQKDVFDRVLKNLIS